MLADGKPYCEIGAALDFRSIYGSFWNGRFEKHRLAGLYGRHKARKVAVLTPAVEPRILERTRQRALGWIHALEHSAPWKGARR